MTSHHSASVEHLRVRDFQCSTLLGGSWSLVATQRAQYNLRKILWMILGSLTWLKLYSLIKGHKGHLVPWVLLLSVFEPHIYLGYPRNSGIVNRVVTQLLVTITSHEPPGSQPCIGLHVDCWGGLGRDLQALALHPKPFRFEVRVFRALVPPMSPNQSFPFQ